MVFVIYDCLFGIEGGKKIRTETGNTIFHGNLNRSKWNEKNWQRKYICRCCATIELKIFDT